MPHNFTGREWRRKRKRRQRKNRKACTRVAHDWYDKFCARLTPKFGQTRNEAGQCWNEAIISRNRFVWANKKALAKFITPVCVIQSYEWLGAIPFAKAFLFWQTDVKSKWSRKTKTNGNIFTKSIRVSKQKGSSEVYYTSMCLAIIWMIGCNTLRQSFFVLTNGRQIEMKPAS